MYYPLSPVPFSYLLGMFVFSTVSLYGLTLKSAYSFLKKVHNTCTEEYMLAARVPNPMKKNRYKVGIRSFLRMYRRTHLTRNNEVGISCFISIMST